MRRRGIAALLALAAALAVGACGVPGNTGVTKDGPGRDSDVPGAAREPIAAVTRPETDDAELLIRLYLQTAGSGDFAGAAERMRDFMSDQQKADFAPEGTNPVIHLVRLDDNGAFQSSGDDTSEPQIRVRVQQVGTLDANGVLRPPTERTSTYAFKVALVENKRGLVVVDAPNVVLMSTEWLTRYFESRTVYFWSKAGDDLIPEARYLSRSVPSTGRANQIVQSLIEAPAPAGWLDAVAQSLPRNIKRIDNVVPNSAGRLEVNLSDVPLKDAELPKLATQLWWSVCGGDCGLDLKIDGEQRGRIERLSPVDLAANPGYRSGVTPERFAVSQHKVVRLADEPVVSRDGPVSVPVLTNADNNNVVSAAFARTGDAEQGTTYAAVVRSRPEGLTLGVGSATGSNRKTLADLGGRGSQPLAAASMSPPVFVPRTSGQGLVVVDGEVFRFGRTGALQRIIVPGRKDITSIAVAPDGLRVALTSDGALFIASLDEKLSIGRPRPVPTVLTRITAVAWARQDRLIFAGRAAINTAIYETTLDGALPTPRSPDPGETTVLHLTAYPANPDRSDSLVMYDAANDVAWDFTRARRLTAEFVMGSPPSPAPDAPAPIAPFFMG